MVHRAVGRLSFALVALASPPLWSAPVLDESNPHRAVQITLLCPQPELILGDAPSIQLRFTNRGREPLILVQPVPNSDIGARAVHYQWSATLDGKPLEWKPPIRCKTVPGFGVDDFFVVKAGASVDIDLRQTFSVAEHFDLLAPGDYRFRLTYRFDPELLQPTGRNSVETAAAALARQALAIEKQSEPLLVRIHVPEPAQSEYSIMSRARRDRDEARTDSARLIRRLQELEAGVGAPAGAGESMNDLRRAYAESCEHLNRAEESFTKAEQLFESRLAEWREKRRFWFFQLK